MKKYHARSYYKWNKVTQEQWDNPKTWPLSVLGKLVGGASKSAVKKKRDRMVGAK